MPCLALPAVPVCRLSCRACSVSCASVTALWRLGCVQSAVLSVLSASACLLVRGTPHQFSPCCFCCCFCAVASVLFGVPCHCLSVCQRTPTCVEHAWIHTRMLACMHVLQGAQVMTCTPSDDVHATTELHLQLEHLKDRAAIYKVPAHLAPLSLAVQRLHGEDCCSTGVRAVCVRCACAHVLCASACTLVCARHESLVSRVCHSRVWHESLVSRVCQGAESGLWCVPWRAPAPQLKRGVRRRCAGQCAPTRWPGLPPGDRPLLAGVCACVLSCAVVPSPTLSPTHRV